MKRGSPRAGQVGPAGQRQAREVLLDRALRHTRVLRGLERAPGARARACRADRRPPGLRPRGEDTPAAGREVEEFGDVVRVLRTTR